MFDGHDLDAAERLVDDWQARIEERATAARGLSARLAELTGAARSADTPTGRAVIASYTARQQRADG